VAEGVARIDPRPAIRTRGRAVFGVDMERLHFFDPATGAAIARPGRWPRPGDGIVGSWPMHCRNRR
jgi:hypothetical protein